MAIDKINSNALTDSTVVAADIADGTITSAKLAGSIANAKLSNSSITVNGQTINLGATGAVPDVQWQSVVVSDGSTVTTMVAGRGYFVDNTSAAGIVKLPASASAGDMISIKDYAGNFATNNLVIQRNSHKIQGNTTDSTIETNRASLTLVYVDATKGWLYTNESNVQDLRDIEYVAATGGTVATSGDHKIHTFTGDANFVVSNAGNANGSNTVDYLVIAGGGGTGGSGTGGGGAGGYRFSDGTASGSYSAGPSPLGASALPVSAQTYPVTVGGGGTGGTGRGSNSIFSTITSTGGGAAASQLSQPGGSGAGETQPGDYAPEPGAAGAGNTPPVSPPQGNPGGEALSPAKGGGGGGAGGAGSDATPGTAGVGGVGLASSITASPVTRGGGGGGGAHFPGYNPGPASGGGGAGGTFSSPGAGTAGTANTGGGAGGGGGRTGINGGGPSTGGSGVVFIRYKFQN